MRLNKMTGRVIATMGIAAMMMTQTGRGYGCRADREQAIKSCLL